MLSRRVSTGIVHRRAWSYTFYINASRAYIYSNRAPQPRPLAISRPGRGRLPKPAEPNVPTQRSSHLSQTPGQERRPERRAVLAISLITAYDLPHSQEYLYNSEGWNLSRPENVPLPRVRV